MKMEFEPSHASAVLRKDEERGTSRRGFIRMAAVPAAGFLVVPRHVLGGRGYAAPSDVVNIAGVGVGGMGRNNMVRVSSQNVVAFCDVDWDYVDRGFSRLTTSTPKPPATLERLTPEQRRRFEDSLKDVARMKEHIARAKRYSDFREMLDKQKDIDAVVVATADHTHASIASAAMDLGKHVYVQKPLTWSVFEARHLGKKAKEKKLVTQMGNQGHSTDDARLVNEFIAAGVIGDVREVHVWTNRPVGFWPQGIPRPEPKVDLEKAPWNQKGVADRLAQAIAGPYPKPEKLAWDLFLGPAPAIEYHPLYHPHHWRGWVDWGCGALGDMGAHLIDHPFWALNLGLPTSIETVSTPFNGVSYPVATMTVYEFPARDRMPPVRLTWYDGGLQPPRPEELGDEALNAEGGVLYIGSKGKLIHETYGANPRLLPKSLGDSAGKPPERLPRVKTTHEMNWVEAIKGNTQASCPFEYASRLTETMLLGLVALRAGAKIRYEGENMLVTNNTAANQYLKRETRPGWALT